MKRRILHITMGFMLLLSPIFISPVQADEPPPPPPHGHGGDWQPGGAAPVGNGAIFLIVLGVAYGLKRVYQQRRKLME
ncbi:MAG: hypothetical protein U9R60_16400 [Bacteroidota bacterium]|nr:hypothetical protein [Bacteroidota bacterium]